MNLTDRLVASGIHLEFEPANHPLGIDDPTLSYSITLPGDKDPRIVGYSTDIVQTLVQEMDRIDAYKKHWNIT